MLSSDDGFPVSLTYALPNTVVCVPTVAASHSTTETPEVVPVENAPDSGEWMACVALNWATPPATTDTASKAVPEMPPEFSGVIVPPLVPPAKLLVGKPPPGAIPPAARRPDPDSAALPIRFLTGE